MFIRGIRGAIRVKANTRAAIESACRRLMTRIIRANRLDPSSVACAFFTVTGDLNADFPARAARLMGNGWEHVPLLCAREIDVPGALNRMLRVLLLVNSEVPQKLVKHQYLGEARKLRRDLGGKRR